MSSLPTYHNLLLGGFTELPKYLYKLYQKYNTNINRFSIILPRSACYLLRLYFCIIYFGPFSRKLMYFMECEWENSIYRFLQPFSNSIFVNWFAYHRWKSLIYPSRLKPSFRTSQSNTVNGIQKLFVTYFNNIDIGDMSFSMFTDRVLLDLFSYG